MPETLPTAVNTATTVQHLFLAGRYVRRALACVGRLRLVVDARKGKGAYVVLPSATTRKQVDDARESLRWALDELDALAAQLAPAGEER